MHTEIILFGMAIFLGVLIVVVEKINKWEARINERKWKKSRKIISDAEKRAAPKDETRRNRDE